MRIQNGTVQIVGIDFISPIKFNPEYPNYWNGIRFIDEDNTPVLISMDVFMKLYEVLKNAVDDAGIDWGDFRN